MYYRTGSVLCHGVAGFTTGALKTTTLNDYNTILAQCYKGKLHGPSFFEANTAVVFKLLVGETSVLDGSVETAYSNDTCDFYADFFSLCRAITSNSVTLITTIVVSRDTAITVNAALATVCCVKILICGETVLVMILAVERLVTSNKPSKSTLTTSNWFAAFCAPLLDIFPYNILQQIRSSRWHDIGDVIAKSQLRTPGSVHILSSRSLQNSLEE